MLRTQLVKPFERLSETKLISRRVPLYRTHNVTAPCVGRSSRVSISLRTPNAQPSVAEREHVFIAVVDANHSVRGTLTRCWTSC